jgi:hypothetical protein
MDDLFFYFHGNFRLTGQPPAKLFLVIRLGLDVFPWSVCPTAAVQFFQFRFGQRFGERKSEVQAERRLERSRSATTAAVPLTEAQRDCVFHFRPRRARVTPQRNVRWSRRATFALRTSFSFCAEIAQTTAFSSGKLAQ